MCWPKATGILGTFKGNPSCRGPLTWERICNKPLKRTAAGWQPAGGGFSVHANLARYLPKPAFSLGFHTKPHALSIPGSCADSSRQNSAPGGFPPSSRRKGPHRLHLCCSFPHLIRVLMDPPGKEDDAVKFSFTGHIFSSISASPLHVFPSTLCILTYFFLIAFWENL